MRYVHRKLVLSVIVVVILGSIVVYDQPSRGVIVDTAVLVPDTAPAVEAFRIVEWPDDMLDATKIDDTSAGKAAAESIVASLLGPVQVSVREEIIRGPRINLLAPARDNEQAVDVARRHGARTWLEAVGQLLAK